MLYIVDVICIRYFLAWAWWPNTGREEASPGGLQFRFPRWHGVRVGIQKKCTALQPYALYTCTSVDKVSMR